MRFKEWLVQEAGHFSMNGLPVSIMAVLDGQPSLFKDVTMVDPRLEFHNIPHPNPSPNRTKFLGDVEFSLPLVNPSGKIYGYIVSKRGGGLSGVGFMSKTPSGVELPINWPDHAIIMDSHGRDLVSGRNFKVYPTPVNDKMLQTQ